MSLTGMGCSVGLTAGLPGEGVSMRERKGEHPFGDAGQLIALGIFLVVCGCAYRQSESRVQGPCRIGSSNEEAAQQQEHAGYPQRLVVASSTNSTELGVDVVHTSVQAK